MALSDLVAEGFDRPISAIRRYAISLVVAAVAAIGAIIYAASALLLALEIAIGPIWARLAVAAVLLLIAVAGYFAPRLLRSSAPSPAKPRDASEDVEGLPRDQRLAMVLEALMLGFSMGSRKPTESTDGRK